MQEKKYWNERINLPIDLDFKTALPTIDMSSQQKIIKDIEESSSTLSQCQENDTCRKSLDIFSVELKTHIYSKTYMNILWVLLIIAKKLETTIMYFNFTHVVEYSSRIP